MSTSPQDAAMDYLYSAAEALWTANRRDVHYTELAEAAYNGNGARKTPIPLLNQTLEGVRALLLKLANRFNKRVNAEGAPDPIRTYCVTPPFYGLPPRGTGVAVPVASYGPSRHQRKSLATLTAMRDSELSALVVGPSGFRAAGLYWPTVNADPEAPIEDPIEQAYFKWFSGLERKFTEKFVNELNGAASNGRITESEADGLAARALDPTYLGRVLKAAHHTIP